MPELTRPYPPIFTCFAGSLKFSLSAGNVGLGRSRVAINENNVTRSGAAALPKPIDACRPAHSLQEIHFRMPLKITEKEYFSLTFS